MTDIDRFVLEQRVLLEVVAEVTTQLVYVRRIISQEQPSMLFLD
jgi:hypothetical protein